MYLSCTKLCSRIKQIVQHYRNYAITSLNEEIRGRREARRVLQIAVLTLSLLSSLPLT